MAIFRPKWTLPDNVQARITTRTEGVSHGCFNSFNLGAHVGDIDEAVVQNRAILAHQLPHSPLWLNQIHSTTVVNAEHPHTCDADGAYSTKENLVCLIMTADCLPVLMCNKQGTQVAAVHAGWRGLCHGILEAAVANFTDPQEVMCYLGPAIGPEYFEVGAEVRQQFIDKDVKAGSCFKAKGDKYLADLYKLARQRLTNIGVTDITGEVDCTYSQPDKYFSYRRDGQTGRMASLIWIKQT
ncbi:peptidoglycan editing factor PgeF [Paraferrimonas sp. SM1919]|uniref:peptidoglycan editing factor PgeF n=1 Tax=Paraferrimonas sp. SM1919 TaxID=2662263 RepID=UPI0013D33B17|nr:peptidoglycan editing factor PgeF [Paraferrimonas sp. SM1919]